MPTAEFATATALGSAKTGFAPVEKSGRRKMTIDRAIEILTPDRRPGYSPGEYEEALAMAREALRYWMTTSMAPSMMELRGRQ